MLQYMSKQQILVYVGGFFGISFFLIAYFLGNINTTINPTKAQWDRVSGLPNERMITSTHLDTNIVTNSEGWAIFLTIESYGSIFIVIFWSLLASTCSTETAKTSYPFVVVASQLGAVLGPTLATYSKVNNYKVVY